MHKLDQMRGRHEPSQLPWRKHTMNLLCTDAEELTKTLDEDRVWIRRKVSPRQALSTYLHFSDSFASLQLVELFWGVVDDDFHHVLLNGRNIQVEPSRPLYLLNEVPRIYYETYGFAWLVWISAHYLFVPLHILDILFDNIPAVDYFTDADARTTYADRAKRLVFDKNWFVAYYARTKGWSVTTLPDNAYQKAVTLSVKKRSLPWLQHLAKHGDLAQSVCVSIQTSRSTGSLAWALDVNLLQPSEETLIACVQHEPFIDVLVEQGTYDPKLIRQARHLNRCIASKTTTQAHVSKFQKLDDAAKSL